MIPLDILVPKKSMNRTVILVNVGEKDLDLALNLACSLRRLSIENFFFSTEDPNVAKELVERDIDVLLNNEANELQRPISFTEPERFLLQNANLTLYILQSGYNVLLCSPAVVFLRNPFNFLDWGQAVQVFASLKFVLKP